jgi:hypothetical protein
MTRRVLERIRVTFSRALRERCEEAGCQCRRDHLPAHVILNGDELRRDRQMPDCIFFLGTDAITIAVVELKGRNADAGEVANKLTNGAILALEILRDAGYAGGPPLCFHILLTQAWRSASEFAILRRTKLRIDGTRYDIIAKKCGYSLLEIVGAFN